MGIFFSNRERIVNLKLADIVPQEDQPRSVFDEDTIDELAASIKEHGVLQPIIVRPIDGKYVIVAGERRYRAAKKLGLETIPAVIRELTDGEAASVALVENIQREDLTAIEEAKAYKKLMEMHNLKQEELAKQLGKAQSTIANKIRLLNLPETVQQAVLDRKITERHARALLRLKDEKQQLYVLKRIMERELTVKETEKLVEQILTKEQGPQKGKVVAKIAKDIRMAFNTLNHAVKLVEKMGLTLETNQEEAEDYYLFSVKIPKEK